MNLLDYEQTAEEMGCMKTLLRQSMEEGRFPFASRPEYSRDSVGAGAPSMRIISARGSWDTQFGFCLNVGDPSAKANGLTSNKNAIIIF